jgi:uncharacterized membrane protein YidH (DUF202 family)
LSQNPATGEPTVTDATPKILQAQLQATRRLQLVQTVLLALLLVVTVPTAVLSVIPFLQATEKVNRAAERAKQQNELKQEMQQQLKK